MPFFPDQGGNTYIHIIGSGQEDCSPQTRAGRTVRRHYLDNDSSPGRSASLVGGSCKGRRITR